MQGCKTYSNPKLLTPHFCVCRGARCASSRNYTRPASCALHADFYDVSAIAAYIIATCWSHSFVRGYSPIHKPKFRLRGIKTKDLAPTISNRFLEKWKKLQENESHLNFSTCNKKSLAFRHDCKPPSYIRQCILFPYLEEISQSMAFSTIPAKKG